MEKKNVKSTRLVMVIILKSLVLKQPYSNISVTHFTSMRLNH